MAGETKSTLQTILENVRDAGVAFGNRFADPGQVPTELKRLLADLGIADPLGSVSSALAVAATAWRDLASSLSGVSLNFADPPAALAGLKDKATRISGDLDKIIQAPQDAVAGLGASAATIKNIFVERLLHYIVYEFIVSTHPKIGGAFLLLGVLRREPRGADGNPALIAAQVRVFDLVQFVKAIQDPRGSFLTVMRWGTDDFLGRPVVDGMALLLGTIPGMSRGDPEDLFPLADEAAFVGPPGAVTDSARRTLSIDGITLSFVGLHRHGVGLLVPNPVNVSGNLIPSPGGDRIFAIKPGVPPATGDPQFVVLP
jgi:hypothetical protein